jgi:hypothetical protein
MNTIIHRQAAAKRTAQVLAAATAITAAGFLTGPTPAQAHPMLPLAPPAASTALMGIFQSDRTTVGRRSSPRPDHLPARAGLSPSTRTTLPRTRGTSLAAASRVATSTSPYASTQLGQSAIRALWVTTASCTVVNLRAGTGTP